MIATRRRLCLEVIRLVDGRFWARVRDRDAGIDCGLVSLRRAEALIAALLEPADVGTAVVPTTTRGRVAPCGADVACGAGAPAGGRRPAMTLGVTVAYLLLEGETERGTVPQVSVVRPDRSVEYGRLSLPDLRFLIQALLPAQPP